MHPGQNLSYFIRGGNNRQVLVRIDGIVVSDPSQIESEFDLRLLALDQIQSVEVVKGASSSLYGSGAATAVIDITTKNTATEKTSLQIAQEWGTQNTHNQKLGSFSDVQKQYLQLQRSIAKIGLSASVSRFTSDGMSSVVGTETDAVLKENIQLNAKSQYDGPWGWKAFFIEILLIPISMIALALWMRLIPCQVKIIDMVFHLPLQKVNHTCKRMYHGQIQNLLLMIASLVRPSQMCLLLSLHGVTI